MVAVVLVLVLLLRRQVVVATVEALQDLHLRLLQTGLLIQDLLPLQLLLHRHTVQ